MDMTTALTYPASTKIVLAALEALRVLTHWTQDATYTATWYAPTTHRVVGAVEDGDALTEAATLAAANAAGGSYYWDRAAGRLYVHPTAADPRDATIAARVLVAVSSHPKTRSGVPYAARLVGAPRLRRRIPERFGNLQTVSAGTLELANGDGAIDVDGLDWAAGEVSLWLGVDV